MSGTRDRLVIKSALRSIAVGHGRQEAHLLALGLGLRVAVIIIWWSQGYGEITKNTQNKIYVPSVF